VVAADDLTHPHWSLSINEKRGDMHIQTIATLKLYGIFYYDVPLILKKKNILTLKKLLFRMYRFCLTMLSLQYDERRAENRSSYRR
jgi:hypothetical protein